jgi:hypothetical protein
MALHRLFGRQAQVNKIFVIEGPDGGGKSTLAKTLGHYYNIPILHDGGPIHSRQEFLSRIEEKKYFRLDTSIVYDRCCFISELIYGSLHGHEPFSSREELDFFLNDVKPVLILCSLDSSKEMLDKILLETKPHKPLGWTIQIKRNHPLIVKKYWTLFQSLEHLKFNWEHDNFTDLVTRINECVA